MYNSTIVCISTSLLVEVDQVQLIHKNSSDGHNLTWNVTAAMTSSHSAADTPCLHRLIHSDCSQWLNIPVVWVTGWS